MTESTKADEAMSMKPFQKDKVKNMQFHATKNF